jgi:hypothetical protein
MADTTRRRLPPAVWITREGKAWLVISGDHSWLHGDYASALRDAQGIANGFGVSVRVAASSLRSVA